MHPPGLASTRQGPAIQNCQTGTNQNESSSALVIVAPQHGYCTCFVDMDSCETIIKTCGSHAEGLDHASAPFFGRAFLMANGEEGSLVFVSTEVGPTANDQ